MQKNSVNNMEMDNIIFNNLVFNKVVPQKMYYLIVKITVKFEKKKEFILLLLRQLSIILS